MSYFGAWFQGFGRAVLIVAALKLLAMVAV